MRKALLPIAITTMITFVTPTVAQDYEAISASFAEAAQMALEKGDLLTAQAHFERALVANPDNVDAMIGLGKAHEAAGRTGKGLRQYRLALEMEPNYKPALLAQALAFIKVDEVERASANLAILERLCAGGCREIESVRSAIDNHIASAENTPKTDG